jgi:hypothetical protein
MSKLKLGAILLCLVFFALAAQGCVVELLILTSAVVAGLGVTVAVPP